MAADILGEKRRASGGSRSQCRCYFVCLCASSGKHFDRAHVEQTAIAQRCLPCRSDDVTTVCRSSVGVPTPAKLDCPDRFGAQMEWFFRRRSLLVRRGLRSEEHTSEL